MEQGMRFLQVFLALANCLLSESLTLTKSHSFSSDGSSASNGNSISQYPVILWGTNTTHIEVLLSYPTRGWIAMGLSPNGAMDQSDVLFGYVDDRSGKVVIQDRFLTAEGYSNVNLMLDSQQDWIPISGYQNATHTMIRASRKLQTCDSYDRPIMLGKANVLVSFNNNDLALTETGRIMKHNKRGSASFDFLSASSIPPPSPAGSKTMSITMGNVDIAAGVLTQYICRYIKVPHLDRKHHIIMDRPMIDPRSTNLLHHLEVYLCTGPPSDGNLEPFECGAESGKGMPSCSRPNLLSAWATGGQGTTYPPEAGYPISPNDDQYVFIQVHYNNVAMTTSIDNSGMSYIMTPQLRQFDIGILNLGVTDEDHRFTIPPRQAAWKFSAYCPTSCSSVIPASGITVVSGLLHMHGRGRMAVARLFRNGKELPPVLQNLNYDFNYQTVIDLPKPDKIFPGDTIVFECTFSTEGDDVAILGGEGISEEMCMGNFNYFPNINWTECMASYKPLPYYTAVDVTRPTLDQAWKSSGAQKKYPNMTRYLTDFNYVEGAVDIFREKVDDHLESRDWTDANVVKLKNYYDNPNSSVGMCIVGDDLVWAENDRTPTAPPFVDHSAMAGCP